MTLRWAALRWACQPLSMELRGATEGADTPSLCRSRAGAGRAGQGRATVCRVGRHACRCIVAYGNGSSSCARLPTQGRAPPVLEWLPQFKPPAAPAAVATGIALAAKVRSTWCGVVYGVSATNGPRSLKPAMPTAMHYLETGRGSGGRAHHACHVASTCRHWVCACLEWVDRDLMNNF